METDAEVVKVISSTGVLAGVTLADGSIRLGGLIAANIVPKTLYLKLIDTHHLDGDFLRRIRAIRTESATLRMNVALSELPNFTCRPGTDAQAHHASGIVFGSTLDYLETAYLDA